MRTRVLAAVGALVVASAFGCSSDDPANAPQPKAASSSSATDASGSAEATDEADAAEPATGKLVRDEDASYRLPDETRWFTTRGDTYAMTSSGWVVSFGRSSSEPDLDYAAQLAIETTSWDGPSTPQEQEPRTVDGVEGYVVEAVDRQGFFYEFGVIDPATDFTYYFIFEFPDDGDYYRDLIDAVLASVEWRYDAS